MNKKYLSPKAYWRKFKFVIAAVLLRLGVPLKVTNKIGGYQITFIATTFIEYYLRAQESYRREPLTVDWMQSYVQQDDVVYDIGANVGAYSLFLGKIVSNGTGVVYAFEPEASNFNSLNKNIVVNGLTGKVIPYAVALGDRVRAGKLFLSSTVTGSALHSIDHDEIEEKRYNKQEENSF